jgi:diguanylate cyclase (GGDEF)-like protein
MAITKSRNPVTLYRILLAWILCCVALAVALTLWITGSMGSQARDASDNAQLGQLAAEATDRLREMNQIVQNRIDLTLAAPEVDAMNPQQREQLNAWLGGSSETRPPVDILELPAALSMNDAVEFQTASNYLADRTAQLIQGLNGAEPQGQAREMGETSQRALDAYYANPTLETLRDVSLTLTSLQAFTAATTPQLGQDAQTLHQDLLSSISTMRWANLGVALLGGASVLVLGLHMVRSTQRLLTEAHNEQQELAELTEHLEYRNNQLNALYNVFNEITDTLSLRYVVRATLQESIRIMRADMVVLRILRGDELRVVGAMTGTGKEIDVIGPIKLGEGPTGRAAKRGRTLRIDEGSEEMMAPPGSGAVTPDDTARPITGAELESGLVVPLIVGARVVGTLSCWSHEVAAFSDGDERVLEMMASQVATAIVAADTTDRSERRALHDPLTLLPNRRQLDEDISDGKLMEIVEEGRSAVVAMIDIDHFKRFNDEYGHRVGDVTLQKVASVLRSSARDQDIVYRYGGEEFVIVFADSKPEDAANLAERLRLAVESAPLSGEQLNPVGPVTISVGLALLPQHSSDFGELINMADSAMYRAKANGRNRIEFWDGNARPEGATEEQVA